MISVNQATTPQQITAVQELMREYLTWVSEQFPNTLPTLHEWEAELQSLRQQFLSHIRVGFAYLPHNSHSIKTLTKTNSSGNPAGAGMYLNPSFS